MSPGATLPATLPVSVVIPCHGCAQTIGRAVASVLAQTQPPAELLLVEDGSTDDGATLRALQALRDDADASTGPVRVIVIAHATNLGAPAARNSGWDAATQVYVAFLDADDAWDARKLEVQHTWMARHPSAAMSGHLSRQLDAPPTRARPPEDFTARRIGPGRLLLSNAFGTRTVMLRRDLPFRFDVRFRRSDDYLLWLSIVLKGHEAWLLDAVFAYYFKPAFGAGGLSGDLWAMERSELAVYAELARRGELSAPARGLLSAYSLMKHGLRVVRRGL